MGQLTRKILEAAVGMKTADDGYFASMEYIRQRDWIDGRYNLSSCGKECDIEEYELDSKGNRKRDDSGNYSMVKEYHYDEDLIKEQFLKPALAGTLGGSLSQAMRLVCRMRSTFHGGCCSRLWIWHNCVLCWAQWLWSVGSRGPKKGAT
mmetsp:Transcript_20509/g.50308  ORF Transcript_20509/g.50308 Transcript_20509/m.50308 type:complete len:149 (-) Transcript_20509:2558-3004(-)